MTEKPRETQAESHVVELKEKVNNSSLMKHPMRWYLMPSTSARRFERLMTSAASSMNCCGLRLKSSSRPAVHEDAVNATPRELSLVLEVCQDVGQLDVALIKRHWSRGDGSLRVYPGAPDGEIGLAPLQARLGDSEVRGFDRNCFSSLSILAKRED